MKPKNKNPGRPAALPAFLRKHRAELAFTLAVLTVACAVYALTHRPGSGAVAVLRYGDPQQELRIPLDEPAVYDLPSNGYTIHLRVADGGIAFVDSPCPDHLCEGFGTLREPGDWAACVPAKASVSIEASE